MIIFQIIPIIFSFYLCFRSSVSGNDTSFKWPTVGISVLVRNKAHTLPYFLTGIHNLDYPKDRVYLWFYSDYNSDNSNAILTKWIERYSEFYHSVNFTSKATPSSYPGEKATSFPWSEERFQHVIDLRESAIDYARQKWADFIFLIDADVFLTDKLTLKNLVSKNFTIVAPLLISDGEYSNFWCAMTETYYYKKTDEYKLIYNRKQVGCYDVAMVHTAVLINLNAVQSDKLTYNPDNMVGYNGPRDDIIAFAVNAQNNGISLNICNDLKYGLVTIPMPENEQLSHDYEQLVNIKIEAISSGSPLLVDEYLSEFVTLPDKWKMNCDEIFMINLKRRTERKYLMMKAFDELGMDVTVIEAVDGQKLNLDLLKEMSITLMPEFEDPYYKRPMKMGEVGCFLSHYKIWETVIRKGLQTTLVLEDDIHFVPFFSHWFLELIKELSFISNWDLVYIGRKTLENVNESEVTKLLVKPKYSYWTLGYLISQTGAQKLLDAKPLTKMLPVDEFLPIMFDQHPNQTWKEQFPNRNLNAYSASSLLVFPMRYTGEEGYVSDTEDSTIIQTFHDHQVHSIREDL